MADIDDRCLTDENGEDWLDRYEDRIKKAKERQAQMQVKHSHELRHQFDDLVARIKNGEDIDIDEYIKGKEAQ